MRRITGHIIKLICILALYCAVVVSCSDVNYPIDVQEKLREVRVSLNLEIQAGESETGNTSVQTKSDVSVTTFWFIEFDGNGRLIGAPTHYTTADAVTMYLPEKGSGDYEGVIIASTAAEGIAKTDGNGQALFTIENCSSKDMLLSIYHDFEVNPASEPDFIISGVIKINDTNIVYNSSADTFSTSCLLRRNLAKLTLTVKNTSIIPSFGIHHIRVSNIPESASYLSAAPEDYKYYDINLQNNKIYNNSGTRSFILYVPQNDNPQNATYIEVLGYDGVTYVSFKVYPHGEQEDDLRLLANHEYTLNIDVRSYEDGLEGVETFGYNDFSGKPSNCYIINPPEEGFSSMAYKIPMTWMVDYWTKYAGAESIDFAGKELVAEVIWQEQDSNVITFCDENLSGNDTYRINDGGSGYLYVKVDGSKKGNILIGIKEMPSDAETDTPYLWSWHLWVTDYTPDEIKGQWDERYVYELSNGSGAVHRYNGKIDASPWNTKYVNKYIMDRNLGAMSAKKTDGLAQTRGLYYQYGRKDPFLHKSVPVYGIDGTRSSLSYTPSSGDNARIEGPQGTMNDAVRSPFTFYKHNSSTGNWLKSGSNNDWNNPAPTVYTEKSIFDPCPPGWKLPEMYTWENFGTSSSSSGSRPFATSVNYGTGSNSDSQAGFEFYISTKSGTDAPTAFYPASGYRYYSTGAMYNDGMWGYSWSCSSNDQASLGLVFSSNTVYIRGYELYKAKAAPARCIQY